MELQVYFRAVCVHVCARADHPEGNGLFSVWFDLATRGCGGEGCHEARLHVFRHGQDASALISSFILIVDQDIDILRAAFGCILTGWHLRTLFLTA